MSEKVIVMRSARFRGGEVDAREILLAEIIKMHPRDPVESDVALARLTRAVRRHIPDVRLSITTLDELTRIPLRASDVCFLARTLLTAKKCAVGSFA